LPKVRARSSRGTAGGARSRRGAGRGLRRLSDGPEVRREISGPPHPWGCRAEVKESIGLDLFRLGGDRVVWRRVPHLGAIQIQNIKGDVGAHGQAGAEEDPPPAPRPSSGCSASAHSSPQRHQMARWQDTTRRTRRCQSELSCYLRFRQYDGPWWSGGVARGCGGRGHHLSPCTNRAPFGEGRATR
jgi:hypothetical protein